MPKPIWIFVFDIHYQLGDLNNERREEIQRVLNKKAREIGCQTPFKEQETFNKIKQ